MHFPNEKIICEIPIYSMPKKEFERRWNKWKDNWYERSEQMGHSAEETEEALREATNRIVEAIHSVLEKTPPELVADVAERGIVLTGGGALLRGLEELIEDKTGINTMTADEPMTCVAIGTGKYVEFLAGKRDDD